MKAVILERKKLTGYNAGLLLLLAALGVLVLCPLALMFVRAVTVEERLSFSCLGSVIASRDNLRTISNSLTLSAAVVAGSTVIAAPLAYLLVRTSMARHRWLDIVLMVPFMTPPYIASMGWILFTQRRGLFQQLFPATGSFSEGFFSFWGIVLVMSLHLFPFMLSILKNALLSVSPSLEESAAVLGAGLMYRLRRVVIPLLTGNYAIGALLVFVKALSEYGTPATLGRRIGFTVFTTDIHRSATTSPIDFGKAAALSSVLVGICLAMWLIQSYLTGIKSYALVGGKGSRRSLKELRGGGCAAAWAYLGLVLLLAIGIPYFSVIVTSLIHLRGYGLSPGNFTFQHYISLFTENPRGRSAILSSMLLAVAAATIAAVVGTLIAAAIRRGNRGLSKAVEGMSLLPEMLPSIVLVIGLMLFWNTVYRFLPIYNTVWMMILAYVVLYLPFTVQYVTSSFTQIGDNLQWAGRTLGASPAYVFRRVTLPLVSKGILAAWMMTFIISFRELVASSMVAPPNTMTVSTFIMREFEQGSVSVGMAMAVVCVLLTTGALIAINLAVAKGRGGSH